MNMHTPRRKPDWQYRSSGNLTRWQTIAVISKGVITPGNFVTVFGLLLVIYGSILLYGGEATRGLLVIILGRSMDLFDGLVAEATKTKSRLGEIVDTTSDKLSVLIAGVTAYSAGLLGTELFVLLTVHHTYMTLFLILFGRRYSLHTTQFGKFAMFASWSAIVVTIYSRVAANDFTYVLAILATLAYAALASTAVIQYYQSLRQRVTAKIQAAKWTEDITALIFAYNPRASNYKRAERWTNSITRILNRPRTDVDACRNTKKFIETLKARTRKGKVLVMIAGGDGTVSSVVNQLMNSDDKRLISNSYILPLWGGNANDFAYMLNGHSSNDTPRRLLARSGPAEIPVLETKLSDQSSTKTIYGCCYISFGASAYAAKQLNKVRFADKRPIRSFPLVVLVRELIAVLKALKDAPLFRTQLGGVNTSMYEHTFINGSRMARVNRVPVQINEASFFHAAVEKKHPSMLLEIFRIITRQTHDRYVKKQAVSFTLEQTTDAQIDGESLRVKKGTRVSIAIAPKRILCINTKLQ